LINRFFVPARFAALALAFASPLAITAPAMAQSAAVTGPATPAQQKVAADLIEKLAADAFALLKNQSLTKDQARTQFRTLLRGNFDIDTAGSRLIRAYRTPGSPIKLTNAQLNAYRAALPGFLVNTYSDRLYDFASAKVSVVRTVPRGSRGDVDVLTRITDPRPGTEGGKPIEAIWQVRTAGKPRVMNVTVNGVNVALTQEADFKAYIDKNGFDALVDFMKKAK
jgi:phospholipid transport system substrate-binding protein